MKSTSVQWSYAFMRTLYTLDINLRLLDVWFQPKIYQLNKWIFIPLNSTFFRKDVFIARVIA